MRTTKLNIFLGLLVVVGLMAGGATPAQALLPAVKGQIMLLVENSTPVAFGEEIEPGTTFTARLEAVSADGSVFPQNGVARIEVTDFFLQIGDTFWDETMKPSGEPLIFTILFGDGSVKGLIGEITPYDPGHADLFFQILDSIEPPEFWRAVDIKTMVDPDTGREIFQKVSGTYTTSDLRVVPIPGGLGLFGLGLVVLSWRRLIGG